MEREPIPELNTDLQEYINNPDLDLPITRRDLSKKENVLWLVRNISIRNSQITNEVMEGLKKLIVNND